MKRTGKDYTTSCLSRRMDPFEAFGPPDLLVLPVSSPEPLETFEPMDLLVAPVSSHVTCVTSNVFLDPDSVGTGSSV